MFTTLTVVGLFFAFAWVQQYFLDRLMEADIKYLKMICAKHLDNRS